MGSFQGHVLPGSMFLLFGIWWISQLPRRFLLCQQEGIPFFSTVTFPFPWKRSSRYPIEAAVKVVLCLVAMAGELFAATDFGKEKSLVYIGDVQHVTMYGFFMLSGVTDILMFRHFRWIPKGTDYAVLALAYLSECILFSNHLHGRSSLDVQLHTHLLYVISACAVITLLEHNFRKNVLLPFLRGYGTLLQGSWFIQVGCILYPPVPGMGHWKGEDPEHMAVATLIFSWHVGGVFVFVMSLYLFAHYNYQTHCRILDYNIERHWLPSSDGSTNYHPRRKGFRMLSLTSLSQGDGIDDSDCSRDGDSGEIFN